MSSQNPPPPQRAPKLPDFGNAGNIDSQNLGNREIDWRAEPALTSEQIASKIRIAEDGAKFGIIKEAGGHILAAAVLIFVIGLATWKFIATTATPTEKTWAQGALSGLVGAAVSYLLTKQKSS